MPTYDYECRSCHARFERFTKVHDTTAKPCPRCGKRKARRLIGAGVGFIFKGSGFYVTDSRAPRTGQDGGNAKKKDAKPEKSDTGGAAEGKSRKKSDD